MRIAIMMSDQAIEAIREAILVSPENIPLRRHLAETLMGLTRYEDAEQEYRHALSIAPEDEGLKLGLAGAFYQQNKNSEALVIVESLLKQTNEPALAYVIHARLLPRLGDVERAVRQYREGVDLDPTVEDMELSATLGIDADEESEVLDGKLRDYGEEPGANPDPELERPEINFSGVGGMDGVKEEIRLKIIHPITHADLYEAYGKSIGGGILLYGPPGCGKTLMARATAGEVKAGFISVGINDVLEMWIGQSERNLREIFDRARRNKPCVLFFDEVDALGASRSDLRQSAGRQLINQFLAELDGAERSNDGVLILAATNAPWHLDSAFRRPGRFDRILFVPPPDADARRGILQIHLQGKPSKDIDYDRLAKKTEGFSGADLKAVVEIAIEDKLREAMKVGMPTPLITSDLVKAVKAARPSTKEWFSTARNYALYSNQGGIYDDILRYLKIQ